jgi:hypothetical protein
MRLRSRTPHLPLAAVSILALVSASEAQIATSGAGAAFQTETSTSGVRSRGETLTYGVDAGVGETDNVTLVGTNKVSQTIATADADFDFKQQSRLLNVDAKGNFTYLDYLQGAYGSQLIGRFDGIARVAIIPERIVWVLQDDFGQAALDPFTPITPTNLENVNYVSTGPDFALHFGANSYVNASARYARAQYATSPFNSNRLLGNLAWGLQLSARSSVSLNGDTERVMFENTVLNRDFDRSSGFGRYEVHGARTDLTADLGATVIRQNGTSTTGGLARVELARKVSAAATLTASVGRDLTDASTSFSNLQGGAIGVIGTAPAAQTSNNYTSNYVSAGWRYQRYRTAISLSGRWEKDLYEGQPLLDFTRSGAEFRVERKLTRALTAEVLGRYYKTDYANSLASLAASQSGTSNFDDESIAAALTWRHGRWLEVKLRCEHSARLTTGIYGYRENRAFLTVGYRPSTLRPESDPGT